MDKELLDKMINDLSALLEMMSDDWDKPTIQNDVIWFAKLVNKTRALKSEYQNQRKKLVGQASQE